MNILNNPVVRFLLAGVLLVLVVCGLYFAGKYVQKTIDDKITEVTTQMTANIQANLQKSLDQKMGNFSGELDTRFTNLEGKFHEANVNLQNANAKLNGIGDVWLRVDQVRSGEEHVGDAGRQRSQAASGQSGSAGTSYAKLPAENVQFLKGEAYRADQCAVRLGAAQEALVLYKGAFEKYQDIVQTYLAAAKLNHAE